MHLSKCSWQVAFVIGNFTSHATDLTDMLGSCATIRSIHFLCGLFIFHSFFPWWTYARFREHCLPLSRRRPVASHILGMMRIYSYPAFFYELCDYLLDLCATLLFCIVGTRQAFFHISIKFSRAFDQFSFSLFTTGCQFLFFFVSSLFYK